MAQEPCSECERRDHMIDELVFALEHAHDRRPWVVAQVRRILFRARLHVLAWHQARHRRNHPPSADPQ